MDKIEAFVDALMRGEDPEAWRVRRDILARHARLYRQAIRLREEL